MTYEEQVQLWVDGNSVHDGQCCPDFSCCRPELLAPKEERELFQQLHLTGESTMGMLGMFLGRSLEDKNIYIAGVIDDKLKTEEKPNERRTKTGQ